MESHYWLWLVFGIAFAAISICYKDFMPRFSLFRDIVKDRPILQLAYRGIYCFVGLYIAYAALTHILEK
jgi:hypothetical protein